MRSYLFVDWSGHDGLNSRSGQAEVQTVAVGVGAWSCNLAAILGDCYEAWRRSAQLQITARTQQVVAAAYSREMQQVSR